AAWRRSAAPEPSTQAWLSVAAIAGAAGATLGWTVENALLESLGWGGILRSSVLVGIAVGAPLVGAAAIGAQIRVAAFADLLGGPAAASGLSWRSPLPFALVILLLVTTIVALQTALGFTFNPRYLDFPFAPLTAGVLPFLLLSLMRPTGPHPRAMAETAAAVV